MKILDFQDKLASKYFDKLRSLTSVRINYELRTNILDPIRSIMYWELFDC